MCRSRARWDWCFPSGRERAFSFLRSLRKGHMRGLSWDGIGYTCCAMPRHAAPCCAPEKHGSENGKPRASCSSHWFHGRTPTYLTNMITITCTESSIFFFSGPSKTGHRRIIARRLFLPRISVPLSRTPAYYPLKEPCGLITRVLACGVSWLRSLKRAQAAEAIARDQLPYPTPVQSMRNTGTC